MKITWSPLWYALDQPIVAGDIDYFYLTSDLLSFSNGFVSKDDCEIKGTILQITHPELGELKGIITMGLDYYLYLADGTELIVNAEESPGDLYDQQYQISDWCFFVNVHCLENTGRSSSNPSVKVPNQERKAYRRKLVEKYQALLGVTNPDWCS